MNMILGVFCAKLGLHLKKVWEKLKKVWILVSFPHFCRFFNSYWVLVQNNTKFIFIEVFCFIWHPTHPWIWLNSGWKELKTFLAVCSHFLSRPFLSSFQTLLDYNVLIDPFLVDFDFSNSSFVNTSIFEILECLFFAILWTKLINSSISNFKWLFWFTIHDELKNLQMTIS